MRTKVRIRKGALDHFRAKARATGLEIQAYLVGEVVSPTLTVVEKIIYPKAYHTQKTYEVCWFRDEFEEVKRSAEGRGKKIVGDIHSHPSWDAVMSPADYNTQLQDGFRICGICSTSGRKTRVRFWVIESALSAEVEYAVTKKSRAVNAPATS